MPCVAEVGNRSLKADCTDYTTGWVDRRNMPVEDLIRSQLQNEEEFPDQRSSHFKLCIAVNFKSLQKNICPKLLTCRLAQL